MTIHGVISGLFTSNLSIVDGGTVVLAGADTFEGYTMVTAGFLALDNATALGGAPLNGGRGTTVDSGATLQLEGGITYAIEPLALNGTGVGGTAGALQSLTGNNTWQGPIKLNSAATIASESGSTLIDHVQIANEGYLLTVNAVGNVELATTLSGAGGLTKDGTGTLTFSSSAPNLYTGPTVVNGGTLFLAKPAGIQAVGGTGVTVNAGATLAGSGSINADVTNAGVVSPGGQGAIGSLVINGNYTQTAGGTLSMELAGTKAIDQLMISGVGSLDGTLNVSLLNGFQPAAGNLFQIMTFGSSSGLFGIVNLANPGNGVVLSNVYDPQALTIAALATPE